MKRLTLARGLMLLAGFTLAVGGTAFGNTYTYTSYNSQHVTPGTPATGTLDLTGDGFVAPGSLTSFTVTFDLSRPNSSGNSSDPIVDITLDGLTVLTGGTVPDMGTSTYSFTELTTDGSTLLGDLNADGKLSYEVSTGTGNYYTVTESITAIDPLTGGNGVPDNASTMALLGLSLLGISAVARKYRSVS